VAQGDVDHELAHFHGNYLFPNSNLYSGSLDIHGKPFGHGILYYLDNGLCDVGYFLSDMSMEGTGVRFGPDRDSCIELKSGKELEQITVEHGLELADLAEIPAKRNRASIPQPTGYDKLRFKRNVAWYQYRQLADLPQTASPYVNPYPPVWKPEPDHSRGIAIEDAPHLGEEKEKKVKDIKSRGLVDLVPHKVESHPRDLAPAVKVYAKHLKQEGVILEQHEDKEHFKVRLDNGTEKVIKPRSLVVTAAPHAKLNLKKGLDFKGVHHGQDPTPVLTDPAKAHEVFHDIVEYLKAYSTAHVMIEGHTATPKEKMDEWAYALADIRAAFVRKQLINLGVEAHRLKSAGRPGHLGDGKHDTILYITSW